MQGIEQASEDNERQSARVTHPTEHCSSVTPTRPKVSAVIPAYNAEGFIGHAIKSILAQTIPVDEIIVVDDGSKDRTAEVASQFDCTRVITQPNAGQGAARNLGVRESVGEWIGFLDADDRWVPEKMETQLKCITPEVGVIYSNDFAKIDFGGFWHRNFFITPSGMLVRRQTLNDVGGFEESRAIKGVEDLNIGLKIATTNWQFAQTQRLFVLGFTGQNESANHYAMAKAELASLQHIAERVSCNAQELTRLADSIRIEYGRNLIAAKQWDRAAEILAECSPGMAPRWLRVASSLKNNRLARLNLIRWLHRIDNQTGSYVCAADCKLPDPNRIECQKCSRKPHHPLS